MSYGSTMIMDTSLRSMKFTVVGDGSVGKTCILVTYKTKEFPSTYVPTVFDNYPTTVELDGQSYDVCLWDTAGSEDYDKIRPLTYPGTICFLLCFAVNDRNSFENIPSKWNSEIKHVCPTVPVILVGTKSDLRATAGVECVSTEEALKMKKKIKAVSFVECSALNCQNVDKIFQDAVQVIIERKKSTKFCCLKVPFCLGV